MRLHLDGLDHLDGGDEQVAGSTPPHLGEHIGAGPISPSDEAFEAVLGIVNARVGHLWVR